MIAVLLLAAVQAAAPQWESLGTHRGFATFVDPTSIAVTNGRVRVRIRGVAAPPGGDGIASVMGLIEVDCAARTATSIEARGYDVQGRLMLNALISPAERRAEPIAAGSPNAAVAARVCGGTGR